MGWGRLEFNADDTGVFGLGKFIGHTLRLVHFSVFQ